MEIQEILQQDNKTITANIGLLAADYLEKTGRKVCRSCSSDLQLMVLTLKNIYKMVQFRFKGASVQYKNKKGDKSTISNNTMTDEKAIEFLKTNPKRIELFAVYPANWIALINGEVESEEEKEIRLAIEAEQDVINKSAPKPNKKDLQSFTFKELKEKHPNITAISKKDFIEKLLD